MGVEEQRIRSKPGSARMVWCVGRAERAPADKVERPVRVWNESVAGGRGDRALFALAGAQCGVVTRRQLLHVGIGAGSIRHRVAMGSLHPVFPSVFAVGSAVLPPRGAETAALLHAGDGAVLSHEAAAAFWGLAATPSFVVITLIGRRIRDQPRLRVHRVAALDIRDVRLRDGLPVTSPARTLIDCAGAGLSIDRLLSEARALKLVTDKDMHAAIERCPGRKGTRAMRALLEIEKDTGYTRSEAERRLKRIVKEAGIEPPVFNASLEGIHPDAYWPRLKVVVEVDGYPYHGHWAAFQRDRARDNRLVSAGFVVLRFTWHQLTQRPLYVVAEVARTLARRELEAA
jgi:very-short-patch-repair endonuclease